MEFRVLGPLEVVDDGRLVPLERRRMRALLGFLLLHANEAISAFCMACALPPLASQRSIRAYGAG